MNSAYSKLGLFAVSTALVLSAVSVRSSAHAAGFTDPYDPSNFTLINTNADGAIDTTNAPDSVMLTGGNNLSGSFGTTDYVSTVTDGGELSFDWDYLSFNASAEFDPFGFLLNGTFTQLTDNAGALAQTGSFSTAVQAGDSFGWQIATIDNAFGASQATISGFAIGQDVPEPEPVPEPAAVLGLLALGAFGASSTLKRRAQA